MSYILDIVPNKKEEWCIPAVYNIFHTVDSACNNDREYYMYIHTFPLTRMLLAHTNTTEN